MSEQYQIKASGHTIYVVVDDKGNAVMTCNNRRTVMPFVPEALLDGVALLAGQVEADIQARIDREQAVQEAQRRLRADARGETVAVPTEG